MAGNDYHFITHWRVEGTLEEVYQLLSNAPDFVRWWPAVYLDVKELEVGDQDGIGKVVSLHTRGWLPYTLRWTYRVIEANFPCGFSFEASGDFVGRGVWRFKQDGDCVDITFDWKIRADKPLLRYLSFCSNRSSRPITVGPWPREKNPCELSWRGASCQPNPVGWVERKRYPSIRLLPRLFRNYDNTS